MLKYGASTQPKTLSTTSSGNQLVSQKSNRRGF